MWLFFSILAPICFAIVHIIDAHFVHDVFERPWMVTVVSAFSAFMVFLTIPFVLPLVPMDMPSLPVVALALFTGMLLQVNQTLYFHALAHTEAGIVSAYWNVSPALVAIGSFFAFGEVLPVSKYLGIAVLIAASIAICLADTHGRGRWRALTLAVIGASVYAVVIVLLKVVYNEVSFYTGYLMVSVGVVSSGLLPLLLKKYRLSFFRNIPKIKSIFRLFLFTEGVNLIGYLCIEIAVMLGIPSLVSAVETTAPGFTFLLSMTLVGFLPRFGNPHTRKNIGIKMGSVAIMTFGLWILTT